MQPVSGQRVLHASVKGRNAMNKTLITVLAASAALIATPVIAADNADNYSSEKMQTEGQMNPTAGQGAPSDQQPGAPTSARTPNKTTPTPDTQVDRSKSGETSDRTPSNHKN
jgi:hypothetical protein